MHKQLLVPYNKKLLVPYECLTSSRFEHGREGLEGGWSGGRDGKGGEGGEGGSRRRVGPVHTKRVLLSTCKAL